MLATVVRFHITEMSVVTIIIIGWVYFLFFVWTVLIQKVKTVFSDTVNTVEPSNNGQVGAGGFVRYSEVSFFTLPYKVTLSHVCLSI